jgi:hypothetical protein
MYVKKSRLSKMAIQAEVEANKEERFRSKEAGHMKVATLSDLDGSSKLTREKALRLFGQDARTTVNNFRG